MNDHDEGFYDSEDYDWENDDLRHACNAFYNRSDSLTILNLSGQCMGQAGMKRLADSCYDSRPRKITKREGRPYQTHLVCLKLVLNDLHPCAAHDLVRLVAASPKLRYLYLNHNKLSNHGIELVANACFSQLQVCNFEGNEIGVEGAQSLAANLKDTKCTITTLILNHNHLKDDGVKEIAGALKQNITLKCLELEFNHITERGLLLLHDVLRDGENSTIQTILLYQVQDYKVCRHLPVRQDYQEQFWQQDCFCDRCLITSKIAYFLALNKAGRQSFSNVELPVGLWPTILGKLSCQDPALLYGAVRERPDITMRRR